MVKKIEVGLVITDTHYPFVSKKTVDIFSQFVVEYQPDYIIHGGDAFDATHISKYTSKDIHNGMITTLEELELFKSSFKKILAKSKKLKRVQYFKGNHEQRIDDVLEKFKDKGDTESYHYWRKQFDFKKHFPDWDVYQYNQVAPVGRRNSKLYMTHGEFHGGNHLKKHLESYGVSMMYGHLHTSGSYCAVTKADGNPRKAVTLPCACETNPSYMKNKASSWINGFAIFWMTEDGLFNLYPIEIIKGKTIFNGKIYS